MKKSLGIGIAALVLFSLGSVQFATRSTSSPSGHGAPHAPTETLPVASGARGETGSDATPSAEVPSDLPTKAKERPDAAEMKRLRSERQRKELVATLDELKRGGMGHRHPAVVQATEKLKQVEAELEALADGARAED